MKGNVIRLRAASLASKFGFGDGDILDYFCEDNNISLDERDPHQILIKLVRLYLLPLIPHVQVYEIGTIHNPIRCEDQFVEELQGSDIYVDVTIHQLIQCINETEKDPIFMEDQYNQCEQTEQVTENRRKFMVSYSFSKAGLLTPNFGNVSVIMPDVSMESIQEVEKIIKEQIEVDKVIILNIIELEK